MTTGLDFATGDKVFVNYGSLGSHNVTIYAENLYLQNGAIYDFSQVNLKLVCRQLGICAKSGDNNSGFIFFRTSR